MCCKMPSLLRVMLEIRFRPGKILFRELISATYKYTCHNDLRQLVTEAYENTSLTYLGVFVGVPYPILMTFIRSVGQRPRGYVLN